MGTPGGSADKPAVFFADAAEWRAWLEAHHDTATELWMEMRRKHVADQGVTWADAVPEALCFGWIDSVGQRIDADRGRQRWSPRKKSSNWSGVNLDLVQQLIADGRMRPAGLAAYENRRPDRERIYAYEQGDLELPPDYEARLRANPTASAFWDAATPGYRKICINWVNTAKQEATREKRMASLIEDSAAGRLIKSQQYGDPPAWARRARESLGIPAE